MSLSAGALAAGAVATGAPALLRGQNLNSRLDIAFIGAGGRGNANIRELTVTEDQGSRRGRSSTAPGVPHPDENVVVLCDVDQKYLNSASHRFPKAKTFKDLRRVFDNPNDFDAKARNLIKQRLANKQARYEIKGNSWQNVFPTNIRDYQDWWARVQGA